MDKIQFSAWAVDRALEMEKMHDDVNMDRVKSNADSFRAYMEDVYKETGQQDEEMQKAVDAQVDAVLFSLQEKLHERAKYGDDNIDVNPLINVLTEIVEARNG